MSVHDPATPRKPNRWGLYIPFILAAVLIVGWSGAWFYLRNEAATRIDKTAADLRAAGYDVAWTERHIGGFPFRLNVDFVEARIREPSGWGLEIPRLETQAPAYAPTNWLAAAPQGLTFVRPQGGPVNVKGDVIRASLTHPGEAPPHISLEGTNLTFAPAAGAQPFALTAAKLVELHLRASTRPDEAILRFRVEEGKARLAGVFARIAGDKAISMIWESELTRIAGFGGADWPSAVRAWSDKGGTIKVLQAGVTAGEAVLGVQPGGELTVGRDGRLRGSLATNLRQAPEALNAMGQGGVIAQDRATAAAAVAQAREESGDLAKATVTFEAGQTTLGPVAIGPAPKVY
jgi:hypothetical protein